MTELVLSTSCSNIIFQLTIIMEELVVVGNEKDVEVGDGYGGVLAARG